MTAVVILAEHDGRVILVEQFRVPVGKRVIELPAGLVGDEDPDAGVEDTAIKELEEETGFLADRVDRLGEFYSSPGMASEGFMLVRAHGTRPGGKKIEDDIIVHLVAKDGIAGFVADQRKAGAAIDVRLLLLLGGEFLD
jgi:ADP-ribose pyrophosphatase